MQRLCCGISHRAAFAVQINRRVFICGKLVQVFSDFVVRNENIGALDMFLFGRMHVDKKYILLLHDLVQFNRRYEFQVIGLLKRTAIQEEDK
jgi:hypothetical protein